MKPGAYRDPAILAQLDPEAAKLIKEGVRFALANQPISGCRLKPELTQPLSEAYGKLGNEVGQHYSNGLRSGSIVPLIPIGGSVDRYWRPGELFMVS